MCSACFKIKPPLLHFSARARPAHTHTHTRAHTRASVHVINATLPRVARGTRLSSHRRSSWRRCRRRGLRWYSWRRRRSSRRADVTGGAGSSCRWCWGRGASTSTSTSSPSASARASHAAHAGATDGCRCHGCGATASGHGAVDARLTQLCCLELRHQLVPRLLQLQTTSGRHGVKRV